jgi:hypothetical protein
MRGSEIDDIGDANQAIGRLRTKLQQGSAIASTAMRGGSIQEDWAPHGATQYDAEGRASIPSVAHL